MKPVVAALIASAWAQTTIAFSVPQQPLQNGPQGSSKQCPADAELSCHKTRPVPDTCCYNSPGGLLLLTQFWDAQPAVGPEDSWTLHGLWPDNCDGTFEQHCDKDRIYQNITDVLQYYEKTELLEYMSTYWKDWKGDDENLWRHEWNKHGTCISTLETSCYADYRPQAELVDYLEKATELFKSLDTYKTLAAAGILPDASRTYTLAELQSALTNAHGKEVTLNCRGGRLNEVWYFFNVKGSLQTGKYVPTLPGGSPSSCPSRGIKYLPKRRSSRPTHPRPTSTGSAPSPTGTGSPFSGRGQLEVTAGGKKTGCLISYGTWYSTGTCAKFTATPAEDGFTLSSTRGECGIVDSLFECDEDVEPSVFTAIDGKLAFEGKTTFSADKIPKGITQVPIFSNGHSIEVTIGWKQT